MSVPVSKATPAGRTDILHSSLQCLVFGVRDSVFHSCSTKHYFAGSERVCSKLGGGMAPAPLSVTDTVVEPLYSEYPSIGDELNNMLNRFANCAPNELTVELDFDPVLYGITGDNLERNDFETEQYFYHPDHLGSSSFISDAAGQGYQHLQYMPFGETFVAQKLSTWCTPYQFSAKEKDDETGYSYFGARYYNSDISVWLSVDPMSDKHPDYTPYAYVYNNPMKYIDPFGLDSIYYNQKGNEITALRVKCKYDYFFLEHKKGNKTIRGKNYYEGLSRESFFGDRTGNQELFTEIDETYNQNHEWKLYALVRDYKNKKHTVGDFIRKSPEGMYYDYKNKVLHKADHPGRVYLVGGKLLNANELGNVMWGVTAGSFGFTGFWAQLGAYLFALKNEHQADEVGEQQAIRVGIYIWEKYNK
jgi:RHS repeat-associated protein